MKTCPHCGEQIPLEATVCPHCSKALEPAAETAEGPPAPPDRAEAPIAFSHTGYRHVLGYGTDFYGIWSRERPSTPMARFPRTDEGWRDAWQRFSALEPTAQPVQQAQPLQQAQPTAAPAPWASPGPANPPAGGPAGLPPAYAAPLYGSPPPAAARTNGFAIASLVLGILWVYWIGSILALIFGYVAKRDIDRSGGAQSGRGMAIAGIVLGWVGVGTLVLFLIFAVAVGVGGSGGGF